MHASTAPGSISQETSARFRARIRRRSGSSLGETPVPERQPERSRGRRSGTPIAWATRSQSRTKTTLSEDRANLLSSSPHPQHACGRSGSRWAVVQRRPVKSYRGRIRPGPAGPEKDLRKAVGARLHLYRESPAPGVRFESAGGASSIYFFRCKVNRPSYIV